MRSFCGRLSHRASLIHLITCPLDRLLGVGVRLSGLVLGSLHLLGDVGLDRGNMFGSDLMCPGALRGYILVSLSLSLSHHVGDFAFALIALATAATPIWVVRELREFR